MPRSPLGLFALSVCLICAALVAVDAANTVSVQIVGYGATALGVLSAKDFVVTLCREIALFANSIEDQ